MQLPKSSAVLSIVLIGAWMTAPPAFSQNDKAAPASSSQSDAEMMAKMIELAKPGENQKLLAELVGTWDYTVKFWMSPGDPPNSSTGVAVRKAVMDGRYFVADIGGKMKMPGADGQLHETDFKGMAVDAFDNVRGKFISTWIDSMGTGIMVSEGTYDPAAKTFTYRSELEMTPGVKTKIRETIKIIDDSHHLFEWYEDRGGKEVKTMEINYSRQK